MGVGRGGGLAPMSGEQNPLFSDPALMRVNYHSTRLQPSRRMDHHPGTAFFAVAPGIAPHFIPRPSGRRRNPGVTSTNFCCRRYRSTPHHHIIHLYAAAGGTLSSGRRAQSRTDRADAARIG